jgi:hypothetical protein
MKKTEPTGLFSGVFDSKRVREVNNKITQMLNDSIKNHKHITILVVVQTKDGKQKQNWCTVGRTKPENIAFIALYPMKQQTPILINQ